MKLSLEQIRDWTGANAPAGSNGQPIEDVQVTGYSIDSRTIQPGELFFAIRGECFDGHDFVEAALEAGAAGAVIAASRLEQFSDSAERARLLLVEESLEALQRLAATVRRHWGKRAIGITGSAGKTTTKEAVARVLESRFRILKSSGNLNNHFGLPLQLLRLEPEHDVAVLEMGMSHAGEIAALCRIAAPDWAVATNVGMAHAENFPDGQAGVARAKFELVQALPAGGTAILNGDDPRVRSFGHEFAGTVLYYGLGEDSDPRAEEIVPLGAEGTRFAIRAGDERVQVHLRLLGEHNVLNALAGTAAGIASGIPLADCAAALETLEPAGRRGQPRQILGATVIDDCYNSNPAALRAMTETLLSIPADRRIVVAGEMLELGPEGQRLHYECGEFMGRRGVDVVVGVRGAALSIAAGAKGGGAESLFVETPEDAGAWLCQNLRPGDAILLKASRGVRLERALEVLEGET